MTVVILSKNASNLVPCVAAVRKHEPTMKIIVVDDGLDMGGIDTCTDDGCWMCEMDPILRVQGSKPFVFARNANIGIRESGDPIDVTTYSDAASVYTTGPADDVILLNDDALLQTPGGFSAMARQLNARPDYGIVAAACNNVGNPNQNYQGLGWRDEPRMVCFTCVLIPRRTINRVGLLCEEFTNYGFEDDAYCLEVRRAGLKIGIFDGCVVDHASLTPTFRSAAHAGGSLNQNRRIFVQKYGRHPL